jgi:ABC-type multidrug transport system fused ATPase/permease subunit
VMDSAAADRMVLPGTNYGVIATLTRVIRLLDRPTRRMLLGLFGWMVIGALLEAVATALLLWLLDHLTHAGQSAPLPLLGWTGASALLFIAVLLAVLFLVKNSVIAFALYRQNQFAQIKQTEFSVALLAGYMARPYTWHLSRNSSDLLSNIVTATPQIFLGVLLPALEVSLEVMRSLGTLVVLAYTDLEATLLATGVLGILSAIFFWAIQGRLVRWGAAMQMGFARCYRSVSQGLHAVKEAKILGREQFFSRAFEEASRWTAQYRILEGTTTQLPPLFLETVLVVGLAVLIAFAGGSAERLGPSAAVFALAAFRLVPSANRIVGGLTQLKASAAAVSQVAVDLAESAPYAALLSPGSDAPASNAPHFENNIALSNLGFRYPASGASALEGVNLTIKRGETIALVGPSGAGKTTLADLLLGLLTPSSGTITVDGVDVTGGRRGWQTRVGYVPQSIYLTDDTLRRNIALGIPDPDIDDEAMQRAVQLAQLSGVIERMPLALETPVGENGVRLSGGQRQRVGIARALYHNPELLVLDEATSALDNATEREVAASIASLSGQITIILVAHRLSTARASDRVVLMEAGRISDVGTFDELVARNATMRRLVELGQLT